MHITPLDIRKQTFNKIMRGFNPDEVHNFLELVATELENINKDHQDSAEKLKELGIKVDMYQKIEQNMQDTLLTAQRITDEIKVNSQKEADLLIKEAQVRAHKEMEVARERVLQFQRELATLKHQKSSYIARFRSLVQAQMEMLDVLEKDEDFNLPLDDALRTPGLPQARPAQRATQELKAVKPPVAQAAGGNKE